MVYLFHLDDFPNVIMYVAKRWFRFPKEESEEYRQEQDNSIKSYDKTQFVKIHAFPIGSIVLF